MGPVDVVVISFPDAGLMSGVAPLLEQLASGGTLRVVDAVIAARTAGSAVTVTDLEDDIVPRWSRISPDPRPLFSSADAELVVAGIRPGSSALLLAIEHVWSDSLALLSSDVGGLLELHVHVPPHTVAAAATVDS
ncbi:hypothetical protein GCM10027413_15320 [Conyzicola nivalis]|uniref:Uncharacterized protein n=1 Tax=Conyzicola nivalis TaxID=1477021 RepID=A0A916WGY5_9MICO|nr:DUF6325 family protein [Conyzicola nivalis]GGA98543.1 hypothetical protein GCM10010979_11300 [Conyzicola nivalis]